MNSPRRYGTYLLLVVLFTRLAIADVFVFNDESSYLTTLMSLGYQSVHEGFEDDNVWGSVRSTIVGGPQTAPSITNHGISWTANNSISEVTTGNGAARSGAWGFYTLPHGNPPTIGDGFVGTSTTPMFGVGGWIRTNTPPAGISLWLNLGLPGEMQVDFDGNDVLSTAYAFFGVINTNGFTRFDYLETEFDIDEQKFIFADDFTFGMDSLTCDFNGDTNCDITDLNLLLAQGPIASGVPVIVGVNDQFDLTGDAVIDNADGDQWLTEAAALDGFASPYKRGDANLDGTVDGQDFVLWNAAKFTSTLRWDAGDFTGDGAADGQDFVLWNASKFTSSDGSRAVPESGSGSLLVALALLGVTCRRREADRRLGPGAPTGCASCALSA